MGNRFQKQFFKDLTFFLDQFELALKKKDFKTAQIRLDDARTRTNDYLDSCRSRLSVRL